MKYKLRFHFKSVVVTWNRHYRTDNRKLTQFAPTSNPYCVKKGNFKYYSSSLDAPKCKQKSYNQTEAAELQLKRATQITCNKQLWTKTKGFTQNFIWKMSRNFKNRKTKLSSKERVSITTTATARVHERHWIKKLIKKFHLSQHSVSNVTRSCTCFTRPSESTFWAGYYGSKRFHRGRTFRRKFRRKNGWTCNFKSTYIANSIAKQATFFLLETWYQYNAAGDGLAWTTNCVKGWCYGLQAHLMGSTPNNSLPDFCAPSVHVTKNLKNRCSISESVMNLKMLCHILKQ